MKYQQGKMKYELDEASVEYEFVEEEKDSILNTNMSSRYKGVGAVGVALKKGESIDSLLKRFKKNVIESNILTEYYESTVFVKPSVSRRQKRLNRKFKAKRAELNKY